MKKLNCIMSIILGLGVFLSFKVSADSIFEQVECPSKPRKDLGKYHYSEPLESANTNNLCKKENYLEYFLCKQYISIYGKNHQYSSGYRDFLVENKIFTLVPTHAFCGPSVKEYMQAICEDLYENNGIKIHNISNLDTNFIEDLTKTGDGGICPKFFNEDSK